MKDASNVPDLWRMLRDGLPYLTRSEATEVQLALAVSLYAHSKSTDNTSNSNNERVKVSRLLCCLSKVPCRANSTHDECYSYLFFTTVDRTVKVIDYVVGKEVYCRGARFVFIDFSLFSASMQCFFSLLG